jgi:peptide-methionine (S)-S-oxide reductase
MQQGQTVTLAGGCFWCLEAVFEQMSGVTSVVSGYAGGDLVNPSYEAVCSGHTGHAEVVQISFNPELISFTDLLRVFFTIHDPTTLNRQGNDIGTQYRSAIFYQSEVQRQEAQTIISEINQNKIWPTPLVTEVVAATDFYPAEAYHRHYFANHPEQGYCQFVIAPKVDKFRKIFLHT